MQSAKKAVVVDLDGTLVKTDTLLESLLLLIKNNPFLVLLLPFWLLQGKALFKRRIAEETELDAASLPYNTAVLEYIKQRKKEGYACYLVTGAAEKIANTISHHVQLFDGIFSSSEKVNLTGSKKAQLLNDTFGAGQYEYLGNSAVDLKVWLYADKALVVSSSHSLVQQAKKVCTNVEIIHVEKASVKTYLKAIRVHQWVKNALLFVPLLTSHQWQDPATYLLLALGFLAFSLAASSVYVLNDLLDLPADRQHPSKRHRPFAAGTISLHTGFLLFPLLLIIAFSLLAFLPLAFAGALLVYYVLTLAYSLWLKRVIMLDTILLAALYTMRIIAGTLLIGVEFSFWLLAFSMFLFLSLALVKRYTELVMLRDKGGQKTLGRGYHAADAPMVAAFGAASGYIAVLVFALYVNNPDVKELYSTPAILWLTTPVWLYWISRVWLLAHRGQMDDDPIVFAVKDLQSIITGIVVLLIFGLAL